jgi:5-(carboxyamino)imidazole ribonucleotide synthase
MNNAKTIGFLGDGQLAKMAAEAAIKMGHQVVFYGQQPDGPCRGLGEFVSGEYTDVNSMFQFAKKCDVITLENEFIDSKVLDKVQQKSKTPIYPHPGSFSLIENKYIEKKTFESADIPVAPFKLVRDFDKDSKLFTRLYGLPVMMKSSKGGYDGYGNFRAKTQEDMVEGFAKLGGKDDRDILLEAMIPFHKEVAITVARNTKGEMIVYPVVDTIQENHICNKVLAPAVVAKDITKKIERYATMAMECIDAVGVFSFEFFITDNNDVILNESAPRPHNSAHYSMDGCYTSQFENLIKAITGEKLGPGNMKVSKVLMLNLLGTHDRPTKVEGIDELQEDKSLHWHMYNKRQSRPGRKMGHVNIVGEDVEQMLKLADKIANDIQI